MTASLANLHILITRPEQQAAPIGQQLTAAGAIVSCFPVIDIVASHSEEKARGILQQLNNYDNVIFVSRNAVAWAFHLIGSALAEQLKWCRIGAIGNKTAAMLSQHGVAVADIPTAGFTSEHFLALEAMQTHNLEQRKVLIVRGEGGRELLAQSLIQRGASVAYAEVYRRACPPMASAQAIIQHQLRQPLDIIALTSCEGLHNLLKLLDKPAWLLSTPLLVGSGRIASEAEALGFMAEIIVADDPGDRSMQRALADWVQRNTHD